MSFKASDVKTLREQTGAGMMACKKALTETNGDMEAAVDFLRKKGLAAAQKKQSRVAAEGTVATLVEGNKGVLVEVNCETDFVSKGDDFQGFAKSVANDILKEGYADITALKAAKESDVNELTLKLGEKIDIRRFVAKNTDGALGSYNHGGRIGVLVEVKGADASNEQVQELLKDVAMHVAAASPKFLSANDIDEEFKKKEAAIYAAQLKEEGKPENMIDKIVDGKLKKLSSEVCLLEQKFVKDPDLTVGKLVEKVGKEVGAELTLTSFNMLTLGEGIEKKEDNLADEVAKMTGGN
ncbi:MAG: elongation factor Ts [Halobacteriovoraceae bacterium]|nr:elongation factor Ts [Halobacteriovoraceae bacterium]|tara:strand:+ start:11595 stop:12482 length:888 start_codon:yes stop_codon:yes gene_type:complete